MKNYYQYFPVSDEDEGWGLSILNTGCTRILANQPYPHQQHPEHHYFSWEKGRSLQEYQLIYIAAGEGVFESATVPLTPVEAGTAILLFPGEWHRFRPARATGWDEYWVGFRGPVVDNLIRRRFFQRQTPLLPVGFRQEMINLLDEIIMHTKKEAPGYQPVVAGAVLHLLGLVHAATRQQPFEEDTDKAAQLMKEAMLLLRARVEERISMETVATTLHVSYAWFRKTFRQYTGMPPRQYFIQLKIEKARLLLNDTNRSVKEIAYDLNFDYPNHFSKLFKAKTGLSPEQYRKKYVQEN